jgi:RNA polymerase sigma-70 factor (ECF subfamily)
MRELQQSLRHALDSAREKWGIVGVSDEDFVEHLAGCFRGEGEILEALTGLHTADLFLACACLHGDRRALQAFEREFVGKLKLGFRSGTAAFESELKQVLRERVLVGQRGAPPRLASYGGRGPLFGWLKVAAARLAVDLRREQKVSAAPAVQRDVPLPPLDPELSYLKTRYRAEFQEAIQAGFKGLSARDLTLLRLHFLEEVPTGSIARMYRVSARSVQRWILAAQQAVMDAVRQELRSRLTLTESELTSLVGLVLSQLTLSLHRFLLDEPSS